MHPSELLAPMDYAALAPRALTEPPPVSVLPGARSHLNVPYATVIGWRPLQLDLHLPDAGEGPFPVVVYAHGGSFLGGIKALGCWYDLPARGIAVASVAYRLAGEVRFPDPVEDLRAAIRWLRAHAGRYGLDPGRVAGWGGSAGAYLMMMAALTWDEPLGRVVGEHTGESAALSAVVDHYGVADLARIREDASGGPEEEILAAERILRHFLGFDPRAEPDLWAGADPVRRAERLVARHGGGPPFLIMHGDADRRVGLAQSRRLHAGLTAAGIDAELVVLPGADHAGPEFAAPESVDRVVDFLWRTWRAAPAGTPAVPGAAR
ncbi:acetyl esterase/lipase [Thermocatellispora tengchongensis]|uniref:Acetyl esterase/lipase n=1 Tax=Thermocatellispora tengchongensis TaxID=1073253 RepID=A0A840PFE9_9ACTN|nr:alpha/beta hydrolase [Thermocatellispora tengchongensis]MBB5137892.1 acetyl esterase/lipase [Thermocatellispora tengchongensis]